MLKNPKILTLLVLALTAYALHSYALSGLRGSATAVEEAEQAADAAEATANNVLAQPPLLGLPGPEELLPRLPVVEPTNPSVRLSAQEADRQAKLELIDAWIIDHPEVLGDRLTGWSYDPAVDPDAQIVEGVENLSVVLGWEGISLGELVDLTGWFIDHPTTWLNSVTFEQEGSLEEGAESDDIEGILEGAEVDAETSPAEDSPEEEEAPPAMTRETIGKATVSVVLRYLLPNDVDVSETGMVPMQADDQAHIFARFAQDIADVTQRTENQITATIQAGWATGLRPVRALLVEGLVTVSALETLLESKTKLVPINPNEINFETAALLPLKVCRQYGVIVRASADDEVWIVGPQQLPFNREAVGHIEALFPSDTTTHFEAGDKRQVAACLSALENAQRRAEVDDSGETYQATSDISPAERFAALVRGGEGQDAAVGSAMNELLLNAVSRNASDIHISSSGAGEEASVTSRIRVLGMLDDPRGYAFAEGQALVNRLRVAGGIAVDDTQPADARTSINIAGAGTYDLRIAYVPKQHPPGFMMVLRLLPTERTEIYTLAQIFPPEHSAVAETVTATLNARPDSVFLVVGPTGHGKSTTLAALMNQLNRPEVKCLSVENPVEYFLPGVDQIQTSQRMGFAAVLKSFLRSDPDIIMVGEIRDAETAQLAVQAAQTGHRVLSTAHVRTAAGAPSRLLDLAGNSVSAAALADALSGVLAQRLVRTLCRCSRRGEVVGCKTCYQSGYAGRTAVAELMLVNDAVAGAITARKSPAEIATLVDGQTYDDHVASLLRQKVTSYDEVKRVFGDLPCLAEPLGEPDSPLMAVL